MKAKEYIDNLLNESENQKFQIPEKIAKNYKISGDFSNINNWKAKIIIGNSLGDEKIGDFVDCLYVLIDIDSNNIIPISRGDEHRTGYEFYQYYLLKKRLVPKGNYVSINCYPQSSHFIYRSASSKIPEDIKYVSNEIKALEKYLSYGGDKHKIIQSMGGSYYGDVEDYLNRKGNIDIRKGELQKTGRMIVDSLEHIAKEYIRFISISKKFRDIKNTDIENLFDFTLNFLKKFLNYKGINHLLRIEYNDHLKKYLNDEKINKWIKQIENASVDNDWNKLVNIILSADGLKNNLHTLLKIVDKENKKSKENNEDFESVFGDVEEAIKEFNRLAEL